MNRTERQEFITPGAIPLQAADLYAYELFDAARDIETVGSGKLSQAYFTLDKISGGEPEVTDDSTLADFKKRINGGT